MPNPYLCSFGLLLFVYGVSLLLATTGEVDESDSSFWKKEFRTAALISSIGVTAVIISFLV